jgi:haloalkane dehalogenase
MDSTEAKNEEETIMPIIRTPEERFTSLPDFPFAPHYIEIDEPRVHYLDEGAGEVVLCLHGQPSWCFLYRKMIPILATGHRVVAMDFVGFGRSDKYSEFDEYTYGMHRDTLLQFVEQLDLTQITLVCQDWGGLVGLRVVTMIPERFSRLVIMNTGLPTGEGRFSLPLRLWRLFVRLVPSLPIGLVLDRMGTVQPLPSEVVRAYKAPFPSRRYKQGAKAWPLMLPEEPTLEAALEMKKAREELSGWTKPALVMFSDADPFTRGVDQLFRDLIPSARDQPAIVIQDAGHFLQEDKGEEIAQHILDFIERTPL